MFLVELKISHNFQNDDSHENRENKFLACFWMTFIKISMANCFFSEQQMFSW